MRLSDSNTVDYLGLEKDSGVVILTLVDDCDWSDEVHHLTLLQSKLNRYFAFIESGEIYEQATSLTGRHVLPTTPIRINILAKYEPVGDGPRFWQQVSDVAREAGIGFSFKLLPTPHGQSGEAGDPEDRGE